ncbi:MAG: imidazoleglycerol-phosphate dehydratase HisB [Kiritimatiellia bacterium]|jgi:imidazoleglycerol-phosphate dehydratase|nr:imidazoleglycerol-phosphate dehydratase HisB [Kiritimatiellia bacterium]MDP6631111.1 imidazoleglycerol-phosphate dehydratase HisB [Kiritimatiellia bacterium]MDP6810068.1 imidazoleglycerol-phosphate dehydratase HisB [Kiritimatiellia bacterium]MDP7024839.1 imidazoleglycerol-phosphate dehydratase HisB [Kiritimatiellia bacterium]
MTKRTAKVARKTKETDITVELCIDGTGKGEIDTGLPFLDHMLDAMTRHALFDLTLKARGDLEVDFHHTVEDIGLVLGEALDKALGDRKGISRYGSALLPMDDSLSSVAVDLGGRPYLVYKIANRKRRTGQFDLSLIEEFFRAFVVQSRMNLHIEHRYGAEAHHAYESIFKGLARALRTACALDPRETGLPSSKGAI